MIFFLPGCSYLPVKKEKREFEKKFFTKTEKDTSYKGSIETWRLAKSKKLVTRTKLFGRDLLEKNISISKHSKSQFHGVPFPYLSQTKSWVGGKEWRVQVEYDRRKKKFFYLWDSGEVGSWQNKTINYSGTGEKPVCFFSQIPFCIQSLLEQRNGPKKQGIKILIVFDRFALDRVQYNFFKSEEVTNATLKKLERSDFDADLESYTLEFDNQIIGYHFNKDGEFHSMHWVSQDQKIVMTARK